MKTLRHCLMAVILSACVAASCCAALRAAASPQDASVTASEAQHQFEAGNYAGAISTLQPLAAQNSTNSDVYFWLGRCYYELRDYDNSIANLEKAVAINPKNSLYHDWLGRADGGKADVDRSFSFARKVKKEFEAAVNLDESNAQARRDLEEFTLDAPWIVGGNKDEALEQVNAIAAIDPVQGHLARALYDREASKNNQQAESEYDQVLAAKPKKLEPYFEVADYYVTQNRPAGIELAVQAAAAVSPNDPRLAFYRGVENVLADQNLPDAEQELKSYLASSPDRSDWPGHASARVWLGRLYELQGKTPDAAEQYRAALQVNPRSKEARQRLDKLGKSSQ
ncbi:MAG: tetratricopeptide repeat protein [Candidatus Acidiferrales bacterium]